MGGGEFLWRGGLPPFGCEADAKPASPVRQAYLVVDFSTASQRNGGKPPRHKSSLALWNVFMEQQKVCNL
ncbi:hypothetical protein D3C76_1623960 [compost metagenome]